MGEKILVEDGKEFLNLGVIDPNDLSTQPEWVKMRYEMNESGKSNLEVGEMIAYTLDFGSSLHEMSKEKLEEALPVYDPALDTRKGPCAIWDREPQGELTERERALIAFGFAQGLYRAHALIFEKQPDWVRAANRSQKRKQRVVELA